MTWSWGLSAAIPVVVAFLFAVFPMIVGWTAVGILAFLVLVAIMLPRNMRFQPWRLTLPPLIGYTVLAQAVNPTGSTGQQYRQLVIYCLAFLAVAPVVTALVPARERRATNNAVARSSIRVSPRLMWGSEIVAALIYAYVYASIGVPLLSGSQAGAVRVETATPGKAALFIAARCLFQIVLMVDGLAMAKRMDTGPRRSNLVHLIIVALALLSSAGRNDLLTPIAMGFVALLTLGWRSVGRTAVVIVAAAALFLLVGTFRASGGSGILGPGKAYLQGTAQVNDKIISLYGSAVPYSHGSEMVWFVNRITGATVTPPGIYLRGLFERTGTFVGFGLETNVLGAWYMEAGLAGVLIGGAAMGTIATLGYRMWMRRPNGWWAVGYAYIITWMLLSVAIHPFASYWDVIFPVVLLIWIRVNCRAVRVANERSKIRDIADGSGGVPARSAALDHQSRRRALA